MPRRPRSGLQRGGQDLRDELPLRRNDSVVRVIVQAPRRAFSRVVKSKHVGVASRLTCVLRAGLAPPATARSSAIAQRATLNGS
jgi:hypothetical protein